MDAMGTGNVATQTEQFMSVCLQVLLASVPNLGFAELLLQVQQIGRCDAVPCRCSP